MKPIITSLIIAGVLIGGSIILNKDSGEKGPDFQTVNNITEENGKQIIAITARGGYAPKVTEAKAGIPTIIKVDTKGTFDCSSALTIPDLDYRKNLPPSGETLIDVPPQKPGSVIWGTCSMGMYSFSINFN